MNQGVTDYTDLFFEMRTDICNTTKQGAVGVGSGQFNYLIYIEKTSSVIKSFHHPTIEQMDWQAEHPGAGKQMKGEDK